MTVDPPPSVELTESLVAAHEVAIWRYLRYLGCDSASAKDITQEAFLALLRTQLPDRGSAALRGWLRGTALNLMRSQRRALRLELRGLAIEEVDAAWVDCEAQDDGDGYRAALHVCLGTLSERSRKAVELHWTDGLSMLRLAESMGVGLEGARTLIKRTKSALRHCIERRIRNERTF